jgi:hypothetical protein
MAPTKYRIRTLRRLSGPVRVHLHPQYGVGNAYRARVVVAVLNGLAVRDAEHLFGIHNTTIYRWLKATRKG